MALENSKPSDVLLHKYLQEEEDLSQECKELIATLPTETGWIGSQIYRYQGFWLTAKQLQGVLNCQNHFQACDSDILLVTSPKSGTTWLKALTFAILNRKTHYPNPNSNMTQTCNPHPLLTNNPHALVPFLEFELYLQKNMPDLILFSSSRLYSSHLSYFSLPESVKQSRCKIVYLCRDPKDLFVSLWHFTYGLIPKNQEFNLTEDWFDKFCQGVNVYGPIWDHVLAYYKESLERPEKIMFLRFEELKEKPISVLKDLAEFIGFGFSKEEENGNVVSDILQLCNFENLSNLEVNKSGKLSSGIENRTFFRHGEVGDWENFLTSDMLERLNAITEEKLGKYGLKF
ncbi:hypothetical protein K1719_022834 [Acacia pycnantha]|nr:hypothetical protein K1719_022834 [Acacia pycnantha]